MAECVLGANLPWLDYGMDFGTSAWRPEGGLAADPARAERLRRALGQLADSGARLVRLWLLGDGRSGLRLDGDGRPLGLDDRVAADLDAALAQFAAAGVRALPVLVDFLWFAPARVEAGVQLFGRRRLVLEPDCRVRLVELVLAPLADRLGQAPEVEAIDLLNEPEWATLGAGTIDPRRAIGRRAMRGFIGQLASLFRERAPGKPLCVGLASARWRSLVEGLPLDFEQVHWYESLDGLATLARPVAPAAPGRRAPLLGEFPTAGASVGPERLFELARAAGYSGALAWSALASDAATDGRACLAALRSAASPARAARAGA